MLLNFSDEAQHVRAAHCSNIVDIFTAC